MFFPAAKQADDLTESTGTVFILAPATHAVPKGAPVFLSVAAPGKYLICAEESTFSIKIWANGAGEIMS